MQLFGSRFVEYLMAGAFFWTVQLVVLLLIPGSPFFFHVHDALVAEVPAELMSSVLAMGSVLGIVVVLVTGLLLDAPRWSTIVEVEQFSRYLNENGDWLDRWLQSTLDGFGSLGDYEPSFVAAYREMRSAPRVASGWRRWVIYGVSALYGPWRLNHWRNRHFVMEQFAVRCGQTHDVEALLVSYVFLRSGTSNLGLLQDQLSLWRTNRGMVLALLVIGLESLVIAFIWPTGWFESVVAGGVLLLFYVAAHALVCRPYSRLLHYLFSFAFLTYTKG